MKRADVVVIGGSAAGLTAAITSRRHYPDKSVLLIRKEEKVLIPCGIPYIFGTIGSPDKNLIPDAALEKNGIELVLGEVMSINRKKQSITLENGLEVSYEKLVLSTGSFPVKPKITGVDKENIFTVNKNVSHLKTMLDQLNRTSNLVIVGGGFIGAEFADECRKNRDIKLTIVEMLPQCLMLTFDKDLCNVAEDIAKSHAIDIMAPEKVEAFVGNGMVTGVKLGSGKELEADMVILGIGCVPNTRLAEESGLELGPIKGIQINDYMQTNDENIYACGDCAEKRSFFDGKPSPIKLASTATREARIAGANLFEIRRKNEGVIGVFSTILGDTAFALAGLSEREAREKGYNVVVGESEAPNRHPGCMPEMANLKVKLIFEKDNGIIIGGQVMGAKSSGELVNTISAFIHERLSIDDIAVFPVGTHPALTASPIAYQLSNAAEMAVKVRNAN
jgi:pyruvate/2-oxoglutarate dehydrogenase complex dihydrolipoamide dehydrogenase (E3) component